MKFKHIAQNLRGADIIGRLRQGHMIRRAAWVKDFYIRICNEEGFDKNGNAIVGRSAIYTIATNGYFMHLASSNQPLANPRVWQDAYNEWREADRDSEGIAMLFECDWEDYDFISKEDFDKLTNKTKEHVRLMEQMAVNTAAKKAKEALDDNV